MNGAQALVDLLISYDVDFPERINYVEIAHGFGLDAKQIHDPAEISPSIKKALDGGEPLFMEVKTPAENEEIPPVAPWQRTTQSNSNGREENEP